MSCHRLTAAGSLCAVLLLSALAWCPSPIAPTTVRAQGKGPYEVLDLSLLVAPDLPCTWAAGLPPFQINHYLKIGPHSAYNSDIITIDEHTGTLGRERPGRARQKLKTVRKKTPWMVKSPRELPASPMPHHCSI